MRLFRVWLLLAAALLLPPACRATTWHVPSQCPTIQAAMDSAAYGDTVLVDQGTYEGFVNIADGVALVSEWGPETTALTDRSLIVQFGSGVSGSLEGFTLFGVMNPYFTLPAIRCSNSENVLIRGNIIVDNLYSAIECTAEFTSIGEISNNTIVGNGGSGIVLMCCYAVVHNNICVRNNRGISLGEASAHLRCNDCWENDLGDYWACCPGEGGVFDPPVSNFSANPQFCDPDAGDFSIRSCSPCLTGQDPAGYGCQLIGALAQGCDSPSVIHRDTWSGVKALYRRGK